MKRIMIAVLFLCGFSFASISQIYTPVTPTVYGENQNRIKAWFAQHVPEKDSTRTNTNDTTAQIFVNKVDGGLYYYYKPIGFTKLASGSIVTSWHLAGNSGITTSNFLGTNDSSSLIFKVNNIRAGLMHPTNGNTSFGVNALVNGLTTGGDNTAIGVLSMYSNTSGADNSAIGDLSLFGMTTGTLNTAIGVRAGYGIATGGGNTILGYQSSSYSSSLSNYGAILTGGTEKLGINSSGALQFSVGGYGNAGQVLKSAGNGSPPIWTDTVVAGTNAWVKTLNSIGSSDIFGTSNNRSVMVYTNSIRVAVLDSDGSKLHLLNGLNPMLSLKQKITNQEWQVRGNSADGTSSSDFNIYDATNSKKRIKVGSSSLSPQLSFGNADATIPTETMFYYRGTSAKAATLDVQSDSTSGVDFSTIEAEKSDYTNGEGVALGVYGNVGVSGSTNGFALRNLSELRMRNTINLIEVQSNHSLYIGTNDTVRVTIDSIGSILTVKGIANPSVNVNKISGSGSWQLGLQYAGGTKFGFIANTSGEGQIYAASGGYFTTFYSNGSEAMRINTSGNVGIGTTSPGDKLDIAGNLIFHADNSYDIGASGATRPRNIYVGNVGIFGGNVTANYFLSTNGLAFNSRGLITAPSDGIVNFLNDANTGFTALNLGTATPSFPQIRRNGTGIDFKLADNSAFTSIAALNVTANGTLNSTGVNTFSNLVGTGTRTVVASSTGVLSTVASLAYSHTIFTPTTGGTVALVNNQYNIINPAGALLALTVNFPSSPANNDVVIIKFTQTVSTVTYGNGTVVDGITAPTVGGVYIYTYDSGTTSWY